MGAQIKKYLPYGHQLIDDDDIREVVKVLKSDFITQGPKIEEFENTVARYVGAKYAVAVCNGTAALHAACYAAGIKNGDEVIVPTYSFIATANCVVYCKGTPILCDVYTDTLTIDVEEAERKITKITKAIIAVDFAGYPAEWDKLKKLAKKYKLILIDDAAHALGSKYKDKQIGSIADLTTFSFHPVKTITTGEGGMVTTNNKAFYEKLISFRNHGITKKTFNSRRVGPWYYEINELGYNFRMTDIQAALGVSQFKKIGRFIEDRRMLWGEYNHYLKEVKELILPLEKDYVRSAWHLYPVMLEGTLLKNKREIVNNLHTLGIGVQTHYIPIHHHNFYKRSFGYNKGDFPTAEKAYFSEISLPLFPGMKKGDVIYVVDTLKKVLKKYPNRISAEFESVKAAKNPKITADIEAVVVLSGESGDPITENDSFDTEERMRLGMRIYKKIHQFGGKTELIVTGTEHQNHMMSRLARRNGIRQVTFLKGIPPAPFASTLDQFKQLKTDKNILAIVTHAYHAPRVSRYINQYLPQKEIKLYLIKRRGITKNQISEELNKIEQYFTKKRK